MNDKEEKEKKKRDEKEFIKDVMKEVCQEQMRLHPEIYDKNGER